jgi:hypothetical protein
MGGGRGEGGEGFVRGLAGIDVNVLEKLISDQTKNYWDYL